MRSPLAVAFFIGSKQILDQLPQADMCALLVFCPTTPIGSTFVRIDTPRTRSALQIAVRPHVRRFDRVVGAYSAFIRLR